MKCCVDWEREADVRVINEYGPTETVVGVLHLRDEWRGSEVPERQRRVPIGRPIGNTELYIMDAEMELVPVGFTGELYVGGAGVARGYSE